MFARKDRSIVDTSRRRDSCVKFAVRRSFEFLVLTRILLLHLVTGTTEQHVVTFLAEQVIPVFVIQHVAKNVHRVGQIPGRPFGHCGIQSIERGTAIDVEEALPVIVQLTTDQQVVAPAAFQLVLTVATYKDVGSVAAEQFVLTVATKQHIVAAAALQVIVPRTTKDDLWSRCV